MSCSFFFHQDYIFVQVNLKYSDADHAALPDTVQPFHFLQNNFALQFPVAGLQPSYLLFLIFVFTTECDTLNGSSTVFEHKEKNNEEERLDCHS